MDAHKEIAETGRRGRWSDHEKLRIVVESLATPPAAELPSRFESIAASSSMPMPMRSPGRAGIRHSGAPMIQAAAAVNLACPRPYRLQGPA
jgi:hypothetical protein